MTYADIFLKLKGSKFFIGFYGDSHKALFLQPAEEGYLDEGYGNVVKKFLDSDTKDSSIFEQTNHLPPKLLFHTIRWVSENQEPWVSDDQVANKRIKEDIIEKTGLVVVNESQFPCGVTFYYEINLAKNIEIVFNDLVEPKLNPNVTEYLKNNKLRYTKGFYDLGTTHMYHTFNEKFFEKPQVASVIIYNPLKKKNKKIGYTNDNYYFNIESSTKSVIDNINHTKQITKELKNMGMKCYIMYNHGGSGTRILAHTNIKKSIKE